MKELGALIRIGALFNEKNLWVAHNGEWVHFGRRVLSRIITLNRKMLRNIGICGVTVLLCREGKGKKKASRLFQIG